MLLGIVVVGASSALGACDTSGSSEPSPGAAGVGDPFFPDAGNGGYDVAHYDLDLAYRPGTGRLDARARLEATATQHLSSFNLDYRGPRIGSLELDGAAASYERRGQELVITPRDDIEEGSGFVVDVAYRGRPRFVRDPDEARDGWIRTDDGAVALDEPQGTPTWIPCNDDPNDKATFAFRVTVPRGVEAIANGSLRGRQHHRNTTTWSWEADEPMAPYLATVAIGEFRVERNDVAGLESVVAVDPREWRVARPGLRRMPEIIELFNRLFGPYPFSQTGAIVDRAPVGFALETQTRPFYDEAPGDWLVAHELAHQWFGNSVSLEQWPDMWLNEGFATWAQWRWAEEAGRNTTEERFTAMLSRPASRHKLWDPPPGAIPGPRELFSDSVYTRGAMTLEALRQEVGDREFYLILRRWVADHAGGNATIADFVAHAEQVSGRELDDLFDTWLYRPGKPSSPDSRQLADGGS